MFNLRASIVIAFLAFVVLLPARADDVDAGSPADFFPTGILGLQIGSPWAQAKKNPALARLACQRKGPRLGTFDEVCFFKTSARVAGAKVHDGFIARKGGRMVLVGTGITISDPDDPVAEALMKEFQDQVHARFQHTGDDVLFVNMPTRLLTAHELDGYAEEAPALLVELEPKGREIEVFYGFLAPVNAFSAMLAD